MNTAYLLMSISKKLRYELNIALQSINLTAQQFSILQMINQLSCHQDVNAVDLVNHLDMDKPTVSGILSRLEKKGLIFRNPHPSDRRALIIILSKEGQLKLNGCILIADKVLSDFLAPLSNSETQSLTNILNILNIERK